MTAAVFRAEFLRALPLWPWLLAAHAVSLYLRLRPEDADFQWLGGIAEWGVWLLSGLLLVASLWADNPSRRDSFLATRPARGAALFLGKFAGLFLLVGLPFVAADFAATLAAKQPSEVLLLGGLQTSLFSAIALLAVFATTWAWATRTTAATGLLLAFAGATTVIYAVAEFQSRFAVAATGSLFFAHRQLILWAGLAVTGFGLLLVFGKRRPWRRVPLFVAACCAIVFALLKTPEPAPTVDARVRPALVHLDLNLQPAGKRLEDSLQLQLPSPRPAPGLERSWSFSRLEVNGHRVPPWQIHPHAGLSSGVEGEAVQAELRRHFGDGLRFAKSWRSDPYPAIAALPGVHDPARTFDLDLSVLEVVTRWEVVADLPFVRGATITRGDTRWSIESIGTIRDFEEEEGRVARVRETAPALWLGRMPAADPRVDLFCVVDVAGGQVRVAGMFGMGKTGAGRWSVRDETRSLRLSSREQYGDGVGPPLDFSRELRLAILRPVVVRRTSYEWKSPRPVPSPAMSERGGWVDRPGIDPWDGTALDWLAGHPAPAADAGWQTIRAWLDDLHPRIGRRTLPDPDRETLIAAVTPLTKDHLEDFQRYRQKLDPHSHEGKRVFLEAMLRNLAPGKIASSGPLASDPEVINHLAANGRLPEVAPLVADLARTGMAWKVQSSLFADPKAIGLTEAEWLDFYRFYRSPAAFLHLSDTVLPRRLLEEETDRIISGYENEPLERYHLGSHGKLAMARGHAGVPAWLQRWVANWRKQEKPPAVRLPYDVRRFVDFPSHLQTDDERIDWFLAQDPARFVFDPAAAKFQLR
jgi:hypothetical protein